MKGCREKMYYVVLWLTSKFIYASSHTLLSFSANNASANNHNGVELSKTRLIGLMTLQQNWTDMHYVLFTEHYQHLRQTSCISTIQYHQSLTAKCDASMWISLHNTMSLHASHSSLRLIKEKKKRKKLLHAAHFTVTELIHTQNYTSEARCPRSGISKDSQDGELWQFDSIVWQIRHQALQIKSKQRQKKVNVRLELFSCILSWLLF